VASFEALSSHLPEEAEENNRTISQGSGSPGRNLKLARIQHLPSTNNAFLRSSLALYLCEWFFLLQLMYH
jgi:hypothetical protein